MSDTNDQIVDRVLQRMRDTEPPDGMENRIVSALRNRASSVPVKRPPWRRVSLTGCAVLASVVCAFLLAVHRRPPQASVPRPQANSTPIVSELPVPRISAARIASKQAIPRVRPVDASPSRNDSFSASYPAPPMPLTKQEKLLLHLAHKGDPVELAMLDPTQREAKYADERAQVQKFFTPAKQEITSEP